MAENWFKSMLGEIIVIQVKKREISAT